MVKSRAIMQSRIVTGVASLGSNQHPDPDQDERTTSTIAAAAQPTVGLGSCDDQQRGSDPDRQRRRQGWVVLFSQLLKFRCLIDAEIPEALRRLQTQHSP